MGSHERRRREKEFRRKQILDAARKLLFQKGINATTVNQIAHNAELSVGTLYLYFKNKEDIYAALQEEGLDILHKMIKKAASGTDDPQKKLENIALAYLEFSRRRRRYYEIYNHFLSAPDVVFSPRFKEKIDEHGNRILKIVEEVLQPILADRPGARDLRRASLVLWSTIHGMLQFRKLENTMPEGEDFRDLYLDAAACALRGLVREETS
ncbi:MAG TPA: TetR/AcrR family transcriptional regulator [Deltaproteobacteria bacterium]|nr:TetR/AcrR family transcriptional regulator [Deltaproteobacteria bacterium]